MKKTHLEMLKEEVRLAREGKIEYEPDAPYITIRDPKKFERRVNAIRRMNGLPPQKIELEKVISVNVELPKPTLARIVKRAKKEHVPVARLIVDLLNAAC